MTGSSQENSDLDGAIDKFADLIADEMVAAKEDTGLESPEGRKERERHKAKEQVEGYYDRFEKGYEALLQELMSLEEEQC